MNRTLSSAILVLLSSYPTLCAAAVDAALPQAIAQPTPDIQLDQAVITLPEAVTGSIDPPQPEQETPEAADDPLQQEQEIQPEQSISIPKSTAIAATFCSAIKFENARKSSFPVTLFLARPIVDQDGSVLAPVNSLVSAQLKPTSEGVQIKLDALVVGGQFIPIQTSVISIPVLYTVKQDGVDYGYDDQLRRGVVFNVANGLQSWLGNQGFLPSTASGVLGAGLAIASGVSAGSGRPEAAKEMEVPERSMILFPLLSAVILPPAALQAVPSSSGQAAFVCSEDSTTQDSSNGASYDPADETSDQTSGKTSNETSDEE